MTDFEASFCALLTWVGVLMFVNWVFGFQIAVLIGIAIVAADM